MRSFRLVIAAMHSLVLILPVAMARPVSVLPQDAHREETRKNDPGVEAVADTTAAVPAEPVATTIRLAAALENLERRSIGPSAMGGRVVDIEADPGRPSTFYVASASGGLYKTTNNGITFQAMFQQEGSISIGDVAVASSDPSTIWVGTGEANPRNSVSWGDGVYVSHDGGRSWEHRGLEDTRHIGRIAIDPQDPDIVFVAAVGHAWGSNPERGLYRTRDGGKSWERVIWVDEGTGCIDVVINPRDPQTVYDFRPEDPPERAVIHYWLAKDLGEEVTLEITDVVGERVQAIRGPGEAGMHRVVWNLGRGGRGFPGGGFPGGRGRQRVEEGDCAVTLTVGETTQKRHVRVIDGVASGA